MCICVFFFHCYLNYGELKQEKAVDKCVVICLIGDVTILLTVHQECIYSKKIHNGKKMAENIKSISFKLEWKIMEY